MENIYNTTISTINPSVMEDVYIEEQFDEEELAGFTTAGSFATGGSFACAGSCGSSTSSASSVSSAGD